MTTLPPEPEGNQPAVPPTPPSQPQPPVGAPAGGAYETPPADAYQAPPAQGGYQAPPGQGGYQQAPPAPGYPQQTVDSAASTITLNYWLSVFFAWIPALIFWIIEKDKGNHRALQFHVANLNFSLIRTAVGIIGAVLVGIPYLGWLIAVLAWIAGVVLFVFHIIAAAKAANEYKNPAAKPDPFIFNYALIKA